jgi:hypothetical protein
MNRGQNHIYKAGIIPSPFDFKQARVRYKEKG